MHPRGDAGETPSGPSQSAELADSPADEDCAQICRNKGLPFGGGAAGNQNAFQGLRPRQSVEP